jgi:putrescine transport system substrate-binding protein
MSGDMRFGQALRVATIVVALGTFLSSCGEEKTEQQASNTAATSPATNQQATTDPAASTAATPPAQEAPAAPAQGDAVKELNVYNWSDYIGETTIADFEKETGIKVRYETYTGNEDLEAKLVTGGTGYDIVFPSSSFFARQIKIGLYQKLDKSLLPNLKNMDPKIMDILSKDADPGNEYAIPYMWGTNGFSYNVDMVKERMPDAPLDSLAMIFDPNVIAKFKDCGVTFLDSPEDVFPLALAYMGKDPTSQKEEDIIAAADMVMKVRPFIRNFDSQQYLNALPNGEYCISMSWSGDYATASTRAAEAGMKVNLAYTIPKEGTNIWFDGMLIPADAPHPKNANLFLNYMMRPEVIAAATNFTYYANANLPAKEFVNKEILEDPAIYPSEEVLKRGFPSVVRDQNLNRIITREWTRVKTGQ